jgi:hypothetical protein
VNLKMSAADNQIKIHARQKKQMHKLFTSTDNSYWRVLDTIMEKAALWDRCEGAMVNDGK